MKQQNVTLVRSSHFLVRLGLHGGLQAIERRGQLLLADDERWDESNDVRPGGNEQEPLIHGGSYQLPGGDVLGDALDTTEQAPTANGSQDSWILGCHGLESLSELLAAFLNVGQNVVVADVLCNGKTGGGNPRYNNRIARKDNEVLEAAECLLKMKLKIKKYKKRAKQAKKKNRRFRRSGGYSSSNSSSSSDLD